MKMKYIFLVFSILINHALLASILIYNGLSHENTTNSGASYQRYIEIHNNSDKEESVLIYQKDYSFNHFGETRYLDPGSLTRSNASWIELSQNLINMQPGEKLTVPFRVTVPDDKSLSGTYWSIIMVEKIVPPDPNRPPGISVRSVVRYGIQVITHIGNGGERNLNFIGTELIKNDTSTYYYVTIENTGERLLRHTVALDVYDGEGNNVGMFSATNNRTFPGTSVRSVIDLSALPPDTYTALLVADCENDDIFGTNITIEVPTGFTQPLSQDRNNTSVEEKVSDKQKQMPEKGGETKQPITIFGIQVASNPTDPRHLQFPGLDNTIICNCGNAYRVLTATSVNRSELLPILEEVRASGYPDAWIVKMDTSECVCN